MSVHQALATLANILDRTIEAFFEFEPIEPFQTQKSTDNISETLTQSTSLEVVHRIAGRIRWRIPRLRNDSGYAEGLLQLLLSFPEITAVNINPMAASIAVSYNEETMPVAEFERKVKREIALLNNGHNKTNPKNQDLLTGH